MDWLEIKEISLQRVLLMERLQLFLMKRVQPMLVYTDFLVAPEDFWAGVQTYLPKASVVKPTLDAWFSDGVEQSDPGLALS